MKVIVRVPHLGFNKYLCRFCGSILTGNTSFSDNHINNNYVYIVPECNCSTSIILKTKIQFQSKKDVEEFKLLNYKYDYIDGNIINIETYDKKSISDLDKYNFICKCGYIYRNITNYRKPIEIDYQKKLYACPDCGSVYKIDYNRE
jgi:hypothetical protein